MKIKKISLKNMFDMLSDNEMKSTLGGYGYSNYCYPGEYLYYCEDTGSAGSGGGGYACGYNADDAAGRATNDQCMHYSGTQCPHYYKCS